MRTLLKKFIFIFFPSIIILLILSFVVDYFFSQSELRVIEAKQSNLVSITAQNLADELESVVSDLHLLASDDNLINYVNTSNRADLIQTQNRFMQTSQIKKMYDQIRYLDQNGQELIRINFNAGVPEVVTKLNLQNKRGRYYFDETLNLCRGQVFISPFDLNIEHGKVEEPKKPMIRFGTPLINKNDNKGGIVLLNYFGQRILNKIKQQERNADGHLILLNSKGYYLKAEKPELEWGFMYPEHNEDNFQYYLPKVAKQINKSRHGQYRSDKGLFTYSDIHLNENISYVHGISRTTIAPIQWKLVNWIPDPSLSVLTNAFQTSLIFINLVLIVFIAVFSWFLAVALIRKKEAEQKFREQEKFNGVLEMAGAASHELNQPLQAASTYTDILLEKSKNDPNYHEQLSKVKKQIKKIGQITHKLMHVTSYKTKEYANGSQIIDIEESSP